MAKKGETRLQRRIQRRLKSEFNIWLFKVHGGPFQASGIPDLVGSCAGLFFGLEVKMPKGKVSDIQEETMRLIRKRGKGYCAVVTTPQEAVDFIRKILRKEKRLLAGVKAVTETRRVNHRAKKLDSASIRAARRKDLRRRRARRAA